MLKELHNKLTKESEQIKQERTEQRRRKVVFPVPLREPLLTNQSQDAILDEMSVLSDAVLSTRSRIVQSPERIKRNIVTMSATALEDKNVVGMNETKTRDLQAKISILLQGEKVCGFKLSLAHRDDVATGRSCLYRGPSSYTEGERVSGDLDKGSE